jgi:hypothetical protein
MPSHTPSSARQTVSHPWWLHNAQSPAILQIRQQPRTARHSALWQLARPQKRWHVEYNTLAGARCISTRRRWHHSQDIVYRGAQFERYRRGESSVARGREEGQDEVVSLGYPCLRVSHMIPVYFHEICVYTPMNKFFNHSVYPIPSPRPIPHDPHSSHSFHATLTPLPKPSRFPCISSRCHSPSPFRLSTPRTSLRNVMCLVYSQPLPLLTKPHCAITVSISATCLAFPTFAFSIADLTCVVRFKLSEHRRHAPAIVCTITQITATQITQNCFKCRLGAHDLSFCI